MCIRDSTYTVSSYSAGSVTPQLGGTAGTTPRVANGTYLDVIEMGHLHRGKLAFEASAAFVGKIDDVAVAVWYKGTGWTIASGEADCDGSQVAASDLLQDGTEDLSGDKVVKNGRDYTFEFTVSGYGGGGGTITPKLGGSAGTPVSADGDVSEKITASNTNEGRIELEANSTFVGKITNVRVLDKREGAAVVEDMTVHPDQDTLDDMQAALDVLRGVCADLTVGHLEILPVDFTISITPNTATVKTEAEAELRALFRRIGEPGGTVYLSELDEALSATLGETSHVMTAPAANITCGTYEIPVLGTITWA
jgi:hypothetical protein